MSRFSSIVQQAQLQRGDGPPLEIIPGDETHLTESEAQALDHYERVIERGLKTFVEVGAALAHVRDLRLYRVEHATFEAYCDDRWGLARRRAYQIIDAATAAQNVQNFTQNAPATESHAAALAQLKDPDQQAQAWQQALQRAQDTGKRLTAALVEAVVQELQPGPAAPSTLADTEGGGHPPTGEPEQTVVDAQADDDQAARVIDPPPVGQVRVRITANEQEDFQAVAAWLAPCGVQLQRPQPGRLPKYPASWRAYGTLDLAGQQFPVESATPLEVAALRAEVARMQGENEVAHRWYQAVQALLTDTQTLRQQADQRASYNSRSPLATYVNELLGVIDEIETLLGGVNDP